MRVLTRSKGCIASVAADPAVSPAKDSTRELVPLRDAGRGRVLVVIEFLAPSLLHCAGRCSWGRVAGMGEKYRACFFSRPFLVFLSSIICKPAARANFRCRACLRHMLLKFPR